MSFRLGIGASEEFTWMSAPLDWVEQSYNWHVIQCVWGYDYVHLCAYLPVHMSMSG